MQRYCSDIVILSLASHAQGSYTPLSLWPHIRPLLPCRSHCADELGGVLKESVVIDGAEYERKRRLPPHAEGCRRPLGVGPGFCNAKEQATCIRSANCKCHVSHGLRETVSGIQQRHEYALKRQLRAGSHNKFMGTCLWEATGALMAQLLYNRAASLSYGWGPCYAERRHIPRPRLPTPRHAHIPLSHGDDVPLALSLPNLEFPMHDLAGQEHPALYPSYTLSHLQWQRTTSEDIPRLQSQCTLTSGSPHLAGRRPNPTCTVGRSLCATVQLKL